MKQALHILRKDIRRLWYEIFVVLGVTAAFAIFDPRRRPPDDQNSGPAIPATSSAIQSAVKRCWSNWPTR